MKYTFIKFAFITSIFLAGCATHPISTFHPFQAKDLNGLVKSAYLQQKTETFFVINDSSYSMSEVYLSAGFSGQSSATKLAIEKVLLSRMNKTIPNITLSSGLRSFGFGPCLAYGFTKLNQPVQDYSPTAFDSAINSLECSSGGTPAATSLETARTDLVSAKGNIAVIFLSDGYQYNDSPVPAARALKKQYGDRLCIYTIWVGNNKEKDGQSVLSDIANVSDCGFSTTASAVASKDGMAEFVTKVFFNVTSPEIPDTDGDGVPGSQDKSPNTPKGARVDKDGCWSFRSVLFDFDKATIKAGYENMLNNASRVLHLNPNLTVEIQGHTDSRGTDEYNQSLSENRAQAVKQHLVNKGINASRLTSKGFGESQPVASNDSDEGQAENRRVVYKRTDM